MQRCFIINNKQAREINDITFNRSIEYVYGVDNNGNKIKADARDVIIINDEIGLNDFINEYEIV